MFRLAHISDTHGMIPFFTQSTVAIVHSGDLAPNATRGIRDVEKGMQELWFKQHIKSFQERIGKRLFVFVPGNHDYYDPEPLFRENEINAVTLGTYDKGIAREYMGLTFAGFPYVPYIAGEWNYETRESEMSDLVAKIPPCDILVAHCPPYGICADEERKGAGNSALANHFNYNVEKLPRYLLCGHFHESCGIGRLGDMIVSNAATTRHTFEIY